MPVSGAISPALTGFLITEGRCCRMANLTAKQQRFCDEYLIDLNATQAAIRAGYSKRSARQIADSNMSKHDIQEYIKARMAEKEKALIADQDEVLKYLTAVLRGESQSSELAVEGMGNGIMKPIEIIKAPSEKDKLKAAELLGKRYGLYTDRIETDVDMELNINIDYGDEAE